MSQPILLCGLARSHQYSTSSGLVSDWRQATVYGLWWPYVSHASGIEMLQWNWNVTMVKLMLIHRPWFDARKAPSQLSIYLLNLNQSRETFSMGSINPCRDDPIQHENIFTHKKTIYNVCAYRPLFVHAYVKLSPYYLYPSGRKLQIQYAAGLLTSQ